MSTSRSAQNPPVDDEWDQEHHGVDDFIQIRATANVPAAERRCLPTIALITRFTIASLTGNNRNPEYDKPLSGALDWGLLNVGREGGIAISYLFSSDYHDIIDSLRATGHGNAARGFGINVAKTILCSLPSAVIGLVVDGTALYFKDKIASIPALEVMTSRPVSRIIAALISPWIYIGFKKWVVDRLIPTPTHPYNQTPALHPLQETAMVAFSIYDMTTTYEFLHTMLKTTPTKTWGAEAILHHRHFPLGVVPLYALFQHVIDPLAFGRRMIPDAPPFEVGIELPPVANRREEPDNLALLDDDEPELATSLANYDSYRGDVARGARGYDHCDSIKTAGWVAACTTIAAAASIGAEYIGSRIQEDKELLTDPLRMLYTSLLSATFVGTYFLVSKGAPVVAKKIASSSCWASLFARTNEPEEMPSVETDSLLLQDEDLESGLATAPKGRT
jgi:hypothetical protein